MAGKKNRKRDHSIQFDLFGDPIKPEPQPSRAVVTLDFEGIRVRTINRNGQTWWVGKDVCRVLGISDHHQAIGSLDEDEKGGGYTTPTPFVEQAMLLVNESGLYSLIFRSRKPEAKRFRKWVTSEVLPSIRQHGCYPPPPLRLDYWRKKTKGSKSVAAIREKIACQNVKIRERRAIAKAPLSEEIQIYNNSYRAQFEGRTKSELNDVMDLRRSQSPVDRMSELASLAHLIGKSVADRLIEESERQGNPIPYALHAALYEQKVRESAHQQLGLLGENRRYGIKHDDRRGLIIDVLDSLPSPN